MRIDLLKLFNLFDFSSIVNDMDISLKDLNEFESIINPKSEIKQMTIF